MNKKKVGLKISEILLITVLVIFGIAAIVGIIIVNARKGNIGGWLNVSKEYLLGLLTFGAAMKKFVTVGGRNLLMLTPLFVFVDIFFWVSIMVGAGLTYYAIKSKKYRSLSGVLGIFVSTIILVLLAGMLFPALENNVVISHAKFCVVVGLMFLVALLYVTSLIALIMDFGGDVVKLVVPAEALAVKEEPKEEPAKEEPVEEKKEEAAPAPQPEPVKVTVVVEHKNAEPAPAPEAPAEEEPEEENGEKRVIERVPFEYKILHASKELQKKYAELKEYFESYGLKGRISVDGDSYRLHRVLYAQITVAGKKMKVYYKLRTMDFVGTPMPVKDASHVKKYADIPCELDVKSDLSVKRAKELMDKVMGEAGIEKAVK